MSVTNDIGELINDILYDEFIHGFNEEQWEEMINSNDLSTKDIFTSQLLIDHNDIVTDKQVIISSFSTTNSRICIKQTIHMLVSPSLNQRVRYENECNQILRYISVPANGNIKIEIPDLRNNLPPNNCMWMRITRITTNHGKDELVFFHPYPIWMKNKHAKIHHGSIFLKITENNMKNRVLEIENLVMIRLKQSDLAKVNTLHIFSLNQLDFTNSHIIMYKTAKQIRNIYNLRQSILNIQLVYIGENNIAYPTDCFCQTETILETQG